MKRKAKDLDSGPPAKKQETKAPDYCDVEPRRDEDGILWPAERKAMDAARDFIRECATTNKKVLIVPDKDADGLNSGVIVYRTLTTLGLDPSLIEVHLLPKGKNVHDESERAAMDAKNPHFVIVVDQGSRPSPPIVSCPKAKTLIIDHHLSDEFPERALVVSACHFPPVATSALLTYEICKPLHETLAASTAYLCATGTVGDLGTTLKWQPPFPDMTATFKEHTKKAINDAVALLNAPRRTARFDVVSAWDALLKSTGPKDILSNKRLQEARWEINEEVERRTHAAPKFSSDGRVAVLRITSEAQVHPVIATRWSGHLKAKALEIVMCANDGYLPGYVNFSCRIARIARGRDPPVNIIESLKAAAALSTTGLVERMGESFARGHKEASGGIVPVAEFEELMELMEVGVKPDQPLGKTKKESPKKPAQKNNLMNYFGKA
jgi:nanoRNase/pAp phosphatase (c-di-AMP/oligoRNAs hydrolase)